MFLLPLVREQLVHFLPKGGVGAEIGVAEGAFSQPLLEIAAPTRLHLIDLWLFQAEDDYRPDPNNVEDAEQERRYQAVRAIFAREIDAGRVVVQRQRSTEAAAAFGDGELDWIYLDAMHTYEAVRDDLRAFYPKIKERGFILGHDYTNHGSARRMNFGVIEAVNEFCRDTGCHFLALTAEAFPTYLLAKNPGTEEVNTLMTRLIYNVPYLVEIRDFLDRDFQVRVVTLPGDEIRAFCSI